MRPLDTNMLDSRICPSSLEGPSTLCVQGAFPSCRAPDSQIAPGGCWSLQRRDPVQRRPSCPTCLPSLGGPDSTWLSERQVHTGEHAGQAFLTMCTAVSSEDPQGGRAGKVPGEEEQGPWRGLSGCVLARYGPARSTFPVPSAPL